MASVTEDIFQVTTYKRLTDLLALVDRTKTHLEQQQPGPHHDDLVVEVMGKAIDFYFARYGELRTQMRKWNEGV
jgi:hypothetical protein